MKKVLIFLVVIFILFPSFHSAQQPTSQTESYCTFAGKKGGNITKKEIEYADRVVYEGSDTTMKVIQFKLSVVPKNIPYKEFTGSGEFLTVEMIDYIRRSSVPAKFYIEYIRVGAKGKFMNIAPLAFKIVE